MVQLYIDRKFVFLASRIPLDQMSEYCDREARKFFSQRELDLIARVENDPALLSFLRTKEREECLPIEIPLLPEYRAFPPDVQGALEKAIEFRIVLGRYTHHLYREMQRLPQPSRTRQ